MSISAQYESLLSFILFLQQKSLCQIRHRHKSTISLLHLRLLSQHFADEFLRNKVSEDMSAFDFESRDDLKLAFQCLLDSIGSNLACKEEILNFALATSSNLVLTGPGQRTEMVTLDFISFSSL